ncbi:mechanosensitive ion channel family protein [Hathewaya histolytica]|uniref:mechanosensitive ion channel family protein n=1 Tax=Hathewaya histolytica TaxID=1498 RepID=UPI003B67692A
MNFSHLFFSGIIGIGSGFTKMLSFFSNNEYENLKRLVTAIIVFFIFLVLRRVFTKYVLSLINKLVGKIKVFSNFKIITSFEKPINMLFVIFGIYSALSILGSNYLINKVFITRILRTSFVALISWGLYNLSGEFSLLPSGVKEKFGLKVDKILFPFISKCIRVLIIALAATIILAEWNINIQMFITGVGLGGLAFSLAAKDAAANVIAGIILILEKPFNIGEWVLIDGIEGTVEDISFRSTRVRTFTQEVVTIPNSDIANGPITNFTRRRKRKCNFTVGIAYETSREKIEKAIVRIENMIKENKKVIKEDVMVVLEKFSDSSLDLGVYYFTRITDLKTFLKIKEQINFNIIEILKEEGIEIPYPTNTVHLNSDIKIKDVIEEDSLKSIEEEIS